MLSRFFNAKSLHFKYRSILIQLLTSDPICLITSNAQSLWNVTWFPYHFKLIPPIFVQNCENKTKMCISLLKTYHKSPFPIKFAPSCRQCEMQIFSSLCNVKIFTSTIWSSPISAFPTVCKLKPQGLLIISCASSM